MVTTETIREGLQMDCPNCRTWNPDDKQVCWRCQTVLPKPIEVKKRAPASFLGLPSWIWIMLVAMFALLIASQWLGPTLLRGR
jgi:predicted nucleic acid-binding Zn ribbon protein